MFESFLEREEMVNLVCRGGGGWPHAGSCGFGVSFFCPPPPPRPPPPRPHASSSWFWFSFCSPWPLGLGFLFPLARFPVVAVVLQAFRAVEILPPSVALVEAVVFYFFVLFCFVFIGASRGLQVSGSWRKAGIGGLPVEMLFKARSIFLGWFFFDKNLPVAVFGPLRSRWSPGWTV